MGVGANGHAGQSGEGPRGLSGKSGPYYQTLAASGEVAVNPRGPADPGETGVQNRLHRRGSFFALINTAPAT
jgi:hypothetical protein